MNEALVVILAVMWALILLPGALRGRRSSPQNTVGGFERAMDVLGHRGSPGRQIMVPEDAERIVGVGPREAAVIAKRRRVFTGLAATTALTFALALFRGGAVWLLWVGTLVATGTYVLVLLRHKAQRMQAEWVVRTLPPAEHQLQRERLERVVGGDVPLELQVVTDPHAPWEPQAGVRIRRWTQES